MNRMFLHPGNPKILKILIQTVPAEWLAAGAVLADSAFRPMKRAKLPCEILIRDSSLRLRSGLISVFVFFPDQVLHHILYNAVWDREGLKAFPTVLLGFFDNICGH